MKKYQPSNNPKKNPAVRKFYQDFELSEKKHDGRFLKVDFQGHEYNYVYLLGILDVVYEYLLQFRNFTVKVSKSDRGMLKVEDEEGLIKVYLMPLNR